MNKNDSLNRTKIQHVRFQHEFISLLYSFACCVLLSSPDVGGSSTGMNIALATLLLLGNDSNEAPLFKRIEEDLILALRCEIVGLSSVMGGGGTFGIERLVGVGGFFGGEGVVGRAMRTNCATLAVDVSALIAALL